MYGVVKLLLLVQLVSTDVKHVIHIFVTCSTNAMMMDHDDDNSGLFMVEVENEKKKNGSQ